jgi:peptidoglycan/LPS O-acetylase OafA/YrhL
VNRTDFAYRRHITALDGVRAFAFACVFIVHLGMPHFPNGGLGVSIFFTLSGFLITTILLAEQERGGRIRFRRFYARRALRLSPALIVMVAVFTVYVQGLRHSPVFKHYTETAALPVVFYFGNWLRALIASNRLGIFAHTWSLAIEEQFYLVWPAFLAIGYAIRGRKGVLAVALAGSVASLSLRLILWHGTDSIPRIYNGTDTEADQLLIGCALAMLVASRPDQVRRVCRVAVWPALFVIGFVMLSGLDAHLLFTVGLSGFAIATAIIIGHIVSEPTGPLGRALSWRPLELTGRISYGLYLWHFPIIFAGGKIHSRPLQIVIVVITTFLIAAASYRFIEQPVFRLRERFFGAGTLNVDPIPEPAPVLERS